MFKRVRSTNGDLIAFSHIRTGLASPNVGNQPVQVVSVRKPPHVQVLLPVAQGASGETVLERVRCTFSRLIALLHVVNRLGHLQSGDSVYTGRECRCVTNSSAKEGRKGYRADGHNQVRGGSSASQGYVE